MDEHSFLFTIILMFQYKMVVKIFAGNITYFSLQKRSPLPVSLGLLFIDIPKREKGPKSLFSFLRYFHHTPIHGTTPLACTIMHIETLFAHTIS